MTRSLKISMIVKVLWKSPTLIHNSMMFPKGSPLLPFFNHAYTKLRQSGALYRINKKWEDKSTPIKCESDPLEPISFYKIVSVLALLIFGLTCAAITLGFELIYHKRKLKRSNLSYLSTTPSKKHFRNMSI